MSLKYVISRLTIYFKVHTYEKETMILKYFLTHVNLHQLIEKAGLEQRLDCSLINLTVICLNRCLYYKLFSLVLRQKTLCQPSSSSNRI